jgi:hypothetical protein
MEKYVLGLDLSTTNIGFATFSETTGNMVELKHLELKTPKDVSIDDRLIYKSEVFREYIEDYKKHVFNDLGGEITHIFIEQPLGASQNINTVILLASYNSICTYILYKIFNIYPQKISVNECRNTVIRDMVKKTPKGNEIIETLSFPKGWKSAEKKYHIWKSIKRIFLEVNWFYKNDTNEPKSINFDLSDSVVVCIAGLISIGIIKKEDWEKKFFEGL